MKGSFNAMVKLLSYNLEVTDLNFENNLLQSRIRLCIIDLLLEFHTAGIS